MSRYRIIILAVIGLILVAALVALFIMLRSGNTLAPLGNGTTGTLPGTAPNTTPSGGTGNAFLNSSGTGAGTSGAGYTNSSGNTSAGSNTSGGTSGAGGASPSSMTIKAVTKNGGTKTLTITPMASDSSGDYYLDDYTPGVSHYDMLYYMPDGSFVIVLLNGADLAGARREAESAFLKALNVSQATACTLVVSLRVPYFASAAASGVDYGLSFCPGSKPLPVT